VARIELDLSYFNIACGNCQSLFPALAQHPVRHRPMLTKEMALDQGLLPAKEQERGTARGPVLLEGRSFDMAFAFSSIPFFTIKTICGIFCKGDRGNRGALLSRKEWYGMQVIGKILFDERTIAARVRELGAQISQDYRGKDLVMVGILKGAVIFLSDLARSIDLPVTIDFIHAASYGASTTSSGNVLINKDLDTDIAGRHVLFVDTIIDTGETLHCLFALLAKRRPTSLNAAVLLDKACRRTVAVPLAYRGFEIPDSFVAGYGMDCAEQQRNLPFIAVIPSDE
jgi:hypoxanthine phosphoribosyltransferase